MTCPVGREGWELAIEAFYNPDNIRRFGTLLFGDGVFGDEGGT